MILLSDNIPGYSAISALVPIYEKGIPSVKRIKEPLAVFYDPDYVMTDQLSLEMAKLHTASMTLALFEWRLSSILEDNYFCAFLENQMSKNIRFVNRSLDDEHCSIKEKLNILTEFQFVISLLITYADHEALLYGSCFMLESFLSKDINHLTEDIPSRDRLMSLSLTTRMGRHLVHMVEDRSLVDYLSPGKASEEKLKASFGEAYQKVCKNMNASGEFQKAKIMMRRNKSTISHSKPIRNGMKHISLSKRRYG